MLLPWSEVHRVKVEGHEIHLYGQQASAVVNVLCFTEPKQVGSYISTTFHSTCATRVRPNPSIERTRSGLRPPRAAHVTRWALMITNAI